MPQNWRPYCFNSCNITYCMNCSTDFTYYWVAEVSLFWKHSAYCCMLQYLRVKFLSISFMIDASWIYCTWTVYHNSKVCGSVAVPFIKSIEWLYATSSSLQFTSTAHPDQLVVSRFGTSGCQARSHPSHCKEKVWKLVQLLLSCPWSYSAILQRVEAVSRHSYSIESHW